MNRFRLHQGIFPSAAALAVALAPQFSWAMDLGDLSVLSGAGEPLRAEIPLNAAPEELAGASAKLASREIFRNSGIDFRPGLKDLMLFVVRRGERAVVEVRSPRPINEGDLRFLVELEWPSGRVIREYALKTDAAKLALPKADGGQGKVSPAVPRAIEMAGSTHLVQSGETLKRIAEERRHSGVSLEQMLLGLFNANPDAFADRSINRLKTGVILNVPEEAFVAAIPEGEARRFYLSHVGDWNGYRRSLASAAEQMRPAETAAMQASSGKVVAQAQAIVPPSATPQDQVKVDVVQPGANERVSNKAAAIADRVAQEKALMDARERLAVLERNVEDLQRLLQVRNGELARLQQTASAAGGMGERLQETLGSPWALAWLGGFAGFLLALLLRSRRRESAAGEVAPLPSAKPSSRLDQAGEAAVAAAAEPAGFDMSRISLDLSAKPQDDGKPTWGSDSHRDPAAGKPDRA